MISVIAVGEHAMIHIDKSWIIKLPEPPDAWKPRFSLETEAQNWQTKGAPKGISIRATHKAEAEGNLGWCWGCRWNNNQRICTPLHCNLEEKKWLINSYISSETNAAGLNIQLGSQHLHAIKGIWFKQNTFLLEMSCPNFTSFCYIIKASMACENSVGYRKRVSLFHNYCCKESPNMFPQQQTSLGLLHKGLHNMAETLLKERVFLCVCQWLVVTPLDPCGRWGWAAD